MNATAPAAGWFPDPGDPSWLRWWDGTQWTEHVHHVATQQAATEAAQAGQVTTAGSTTNLWPVPAIDAPLFPSNGYTKGAAPGFVGPYRAQVLARSWQLPFVFGGAGVMVLLAAALSGSSNEYGSDSYDREAFADASNLVTDWFHTRRCDARDRPWERMFRARGLTPVAVPRQPDWTRFGRAAGWIGRDHVGGPPRWCAEGELGGMLATCGELVFERRSEEGRATRSMRLFAAFALPPAAGDRHPRVSVRRRSLPLLGERVDGTEVRLESTAVAKSLVIRVSDRAEELATRELFGPQLVAALADRPVCWDQVYDTLVVWDPSPAEPGAQFDAFCRSAVAVARAYWADQM